jgi:ubiquinone/menaquinone biosynthesis C-methylase UbiE
VSDDRESMTRLDWGIGEYERTAEELEPAARQVVSAASISPGERVLDLACGTGNGALLAAAAGAVASGVDASQRLIGVARTRALAAGVDCTFVVGDLHELPFADGEFEVVVSIFGLSFATDVDRAVSEMMRVLARGGRALTTGWLPQGAINSMAGVCLGAVQDATGAAPKRFPWSDRAAVSDLFARRGARASFEEASIAFTAESPEQYFAVFQAEQPSHVWSRCVLERAGTYAQTREQMIDALRRENEDPSAFRATSRYLVARVTPTSNR